MSRSPAPVAEGQQPSVIRGPAGPGVLLEDWAATVNVGRVPYAYNRGLSYLQVIHDMPQTYSGLLANYLGLDIPSFKPWVRKLKALGLTESLHPGYRLSPRGEKVLTELRRLCDR